MADPTLSEAADSAGKPARRRRWPLFVGATIGGIAAIAAGVWFIWVPRYRPSLHADERLGIDVSEHQGVIDWNKVKRDAISFAYLKATEGSDRVDGRFAANWTGASAAGLARGAYHFFTLCAPGQAQAANFLRTVPYDTAALSPALDLELAGNCSARPPAADVQREVADFVRLVEADRRPVVLYVGDDFESRYHVRSILKRSVWAHRFLRRPASAWQLWQVQGFAHVSGIRGRVDLDVRKA